MIPFETVPSKTCRQTENVFFVVRDQYANFDNLYSLVQSSFFVFKRKTFNSSELKNKRTPQASQVLAEKYIYIGCFTGCT